MERPLQETSCRKSSNLAFLRFHHIFPNFERAIVFTNKQCVLRFTLRAQEPSSGEALRVLVRFATRATTSGLDLREE